jgi:hypothetical protein
MTTRLVDHHRSSLEKLLAVEIEYQKKILALSNQRIQAIKKLLDGVDELHLDKGSDVPDVPDEEAQATGGAPTKAPKEKKGKHKKSTSPIKLVRSPTGQVPRLIDALQIVIRNKQVKAIDAYNQLKAKGWLPKSKDPLGYIRFTLSDEKDTFLRVDGQRGVYHLDPANPYYSGKSGQAKHPKAVEGVDDPPVNSVELGQGDLGSLRVGGSEQPPPMSLEDSHKIMDDMLSGEVPLD